MVTKIKRLEAKVKHLEKERAYYKELARERKETAELIRDAWSIVHEHDRAYMEGCTEDRVRRLYSNILYSNPMRTLPEPHGGLATRYSTADMGL